jgi:hypothetical protein
MLYFKGIINAFAAITHLLYPLTIPLFIKDSNFTYSYKFTSNYVTGRAYVYSNREGYYNKKNQLRRKRARLYALDYLHKR